MRLILPPANCYHATSAVRPVVSGLPALQSLDQPLCDASQATPHSVCLDTGSCSPPDAAGSAIVGKQPSSRGREWCRDHFVKFASRLPCGGPLTVLAHQSLLAELECRCLWKTSNSFCIAKAGSVRAVRVRMRFVLNFGFLGSKDLILRSHQKRKSELFQFSWSERFVVFVVLWSGCYPGVVCLWNVILSYIWNIFLFLTSHIHTCTFSLRKAVAANTEQFTGKGSLSFICYLL